MAHGLPVEGEDGPFIGEQVTAAVTCEATATLDEARRRLEDGGCNVVIVVADGLAVGEIDAEALAGAGRDSTLIDVLKPVPSTDRPSVTVSSLSEPEPNRVVVTTPDGWLLGQAVVEPQPHDAHAHDGEDGHDELPDPARMEAELSETMAAVGDHFGDREPSEDELRVFLRDRLVAEGRSPEEADRIMAGLDEQQ